MFYFFVSFLPKSLLKPILTDFPKTLIPEGFSGIAGGGVCPSSLTSSCYSFFLDENAFLPNADALPNMLLTSFPSTFKSVFASFRNSLNPLSWSFSSSLTSAAGTFSSSATKIQSITLTSLYSLTLNIFIHYSLGFIDIIRAVKPWCLLPREALDLMPVVLDCISRILISDRPSLEDTLTEMLRCLIFNLERVQELFESVISTEFQQFYFL